MDTSGPVQPEAADGTGSRNRLDAGVRDAPVEQTQLGPAGKACRLAASGVVLALLLAGTVWGQDSAFPVGPFRMFSTRDDPDAPVRVSRIDGVLPGGRTVPISGTETGLRRAEVEGQLARFIAHPELLEILGAAYQRRHPDSPPLVRVDVVRRDFTLLGGRANGTYQDTLLASWPLR